jgi:hypothetical protein
MKSDVTKVSPVPSNGIHTEYQYILGVFFGDDIAERIIYMFTFPSDICVPFDFAFL